MRASEEGIRREGKAQQHREHVRSRAKKSDRLD